MQVAEIRGRFLGVRQQHSYNLYHLFDQVITKYNPQSFVEIGTGNGAMSIFLGLYAYQRGASLLTFDVQERADLPKARPFFSLLSVYMRMVDAFTAMDEIESHIDGKPAFLFCDGDDKPREMAVFREILPSGSIIAAHDYPSEISATDENGLVRVSPERWVETKTAIWRVC